MGSVSSAIICPRCGLVAHHEHWYHSNSHMIKCSICGYHAEKMIYYEACKARCEEDIDVDGYHRFHKGGFGSIVFSDGMGFIGYDKQSIDDDTYSDSEIILYETWFDGNTLRIKSDDITKYLTQYDLYSDNGAQPWLVYRSGRGPEKFDESMFIEIDANYIEAEKQLGSNYKDEFDKRNRLDYIVADVSRNGTSIPPKSIEFLPNIGNYENMTVAERFMHPYSVKRQIVLTA